MQFPKRLKSDTCTKKDICKRKTSCEAYGDCSTRHEITQISEEEWQSEKLRQRVGLLAKKQEIKLKRRLHYGKPMIGHTAESLVQNTWLKLSEGMPARRFDESLDQYFDREIKNESSRIRRLSENSKKSTNVETHNLSANNDSDELLMLHQLANYAGKYKPIVLPLLKATVKHGKLPAHEMAVILGCDKDDVYKLRKILDQTIIDFHKDSEE